MRLYAPTPTRTTRSQRRIPLAAGVGWCQWWSLLFVLWRVYWANRMPISDCDEVYNYWEPLYYMLQLQPPQQEDPAWFKFNHNPPNPNRIPPKTNNKNFGLQTWEYAHAYQLRSFAYLMPLYGVAQHIVRPLFIQLQSRGRRRRRQLQDHPHPHHDHHTLRFSRGGRRVGSALWTFLTPLPLPLPLSLLNNHHHHHHHYTDHDINDTDEEEEEDSDSFDLFFYVVVFVGLRATIALLTAVSELVFLHALFRLLYHHHHHHEEEKEKENHNNNNKEEEIEEEEAVDPTSTMMMVRISPTSSPHIVLGTALLLGTSAGMNTAAAALVPSATYMSAYCLASAALVHLTRHIQLTSTPNVWVWTLLFLMVCITAVLTTGWPFGSVLLAPLGLRVLCLHYSHNNKYGIRRGGVAVAVVLGMAVLLTLLVQLFVCRIDQHYYHTYSSNTSSSDTAAFQSSSTSSNGVVLATWNIFVYNAWHANDALYGVESVRFYVHNLLLNLNFAAIVGGCCNPLLCGLSVLAMMMGKLRNRSTLTTLGTLMMPWLPWMLMTFPRPHKEERFLFPVYPSLLLGTAVVVDLVQYLVVKRLSRGRNWNPTPHQPQPQQRRLRWMLEALVYMPMLGLGLARTLALSRYYTAPMQAYFAILQHHYDHHHRHGHHDHHYDPQQQQRVCTCGEWHRFPSSFMLPPSFAPLGFLPSSFTGQLPQPFCPRETTMNYRQVPFNDRNIGHADLFVAHIDECDYIVELVPGGDCQIPMPPLSPWPSKNSKSKFLQSQSQSQSQEATNTCRVATDDANGHIVNEENHHHECIVVEKKVEMIDDDTDAAINDIDDIMDMDKDIMDHDEDGEWTIVAQFPFLWASASRSTLHRVLYLPGWHESVLKKTQQQQQPQQQIVYSNYTVYYRKRRRQQSTP